MATPFEKRLQNGPIVVADGGMGTLVSGAVPRLRFPEEANLRSPETVVSLHVSFINAGADLIETNTFGANRRKLKAHHLEDQVEPINSAGVKLAREAREIAAVCGVSSLPVVAMLTFDEQGETLGGVTARRAVEALSDLGLAAVGANHGQGVHAALTALNEMHAADGPIAIGAIAAAVKEERAASSPLVIQEREVTLSVVEQPEETRLAEMFREGRWVTSQLLGAHAEGIRNVLAVTGDPPEVGDYPGSSGVYEVDAIGLVQLITHLNRGEDYNGRAIDAATSFFTGVAVNPSADDLDLEIDRYRRKIDAGADFAMTQIIFDLEYLDRFLDRFGGPSPIPILVGVFPVWSHPLALRLHNEVPGIIVPDRVQDALRDAGPDGPRVGMELARELVEASRGRAAGVYLVAPFRRPLGILELLADAA